MRSAAAVDAEWVREFPAEEAIRDLLVTGQGYIRVIEALKATGKEEGHYVGWLDATLVQREIHHSAVRGRGAKAVLQVTFDAFAQLVAPRTPAEEVIFKRLEAELTQRDVRVADIDVSNVTPDVREAFAAALKGTPHLQGKPRDTEEVRDLIVREQLASVMVSVAYHR